jgi:hypothetical protein
MRIYRRTLYFILAAAFTALYVATLQTSVQAADSGELQLVALTFGIAHPPGYPLWSILAGLFARLPGIAPLTGVSLFSLVTAVATLLFVAHTIEMVIAQQGPVSRRATLAGLAAAAALGVGSTFWAQATSANIRSLTALFAALLAWSAGRSYSGRSATLVLALVLGLGVAHHPSLAFPGLVVAVYVLFRELRDHSVQRSARIRRLAGFAVIAALSQVVWLYLPLRDVAGAAFAPGSLRSLGGFLDHALARGFGGDMFWFLLVEPQRLVDRLLLLPSLTTFVFGEVIAILIAISILSSLVHRFELSLVLVTAACVHLFVTLTYRAPQTVEYALPAWVIAAVLLGVGAGAVTERLRSITSYVVIGAVVLVGQARWSSFARQAHDFFVQDRADAILRAAPVDGFVLAQWHEATPLWVRQEIAYPQSARVEYVAPQGAQPYAETFAARARALAPQAVWVTSLFEDEFVRVGLRSMPVGGVAAWQVTPASPSAALPGEDAVRFDERIDPAMKMLPTALVSSKQDMGTSTCREPLLHAGAGHVVFLFYHLDHEIHEIAQRFRIDRIGRIEREKVLDGDRFERRGAGEHLREHVGTRPLQIPASSTCDGDVGENSPDAGGQVLHPPILDGRIRERLHVLRRSDPHMRPPIIEVGLIRQVGPKGRTMQNRNVIEIPIAVVCDLPVRSLQNLTTRHMRFGKTQRFKHVAIARQEYIDVELRSGIKRDPDDARAFCRGQRCQPIISLLNWPEILLIEHANKLTAKPEAPGVIATAKAPRLSAFLERHRVAPV